MITELDEIKKTPGKKKLNLLEKSEPITIETKYIRRLFEFLYRALEVTLSQVSWSVYTWTLWCLYKSSPIGLLEFPIGKLQICFYICIGENFVFYFDRCKCTQTFFCASSDKWYWTFSLLCNLLNSWLCIMNLTDHSRISFEKILK